MNFSTLVRVFSPLVEVLYPPLCIACQQVVEGESPLGKLVCSACLQDLKPVSREFVQVHLLDRLEENYLDGLSVAWEFDLTLQAIIHHFKYQKMPRLARNIGRLAGAVLRDSPGQFKGDLVLPVPLHHLRQKERGYNQSLWIARGIFGEQEERVRKGILVRTRHTASQTRLNREERRKNVHQAFRVVRPEMVRGKRIILVDDVATTGATLNECARMLKKYGAICVIGVTLATPVE